MFCSHCGTKVEGGLPTCPNCGEEMPLLKKKSGMPRWIRAFIIIGLLGLGVTFVRMLSESDPAKVVEDQLNALANNQLTEAYYGYTSHDFQQATSLEKFKEVIHSFPLLTEVVKYELLQDKIEGKNAVLKVQLTTASLQSFKVEYRLVDDEGSWKILSFKLLASPERVPAVPPQVK